MEERVNITVHVNGDPLSIIQGVKFVLGSFPKNTVKPTVCGDKIHGNLLVDYDECIGKVMFSMVATAENIQRKNNWLAKKGKNEVVLESDKGEIVTYKAMALETDPEVDSKGDGFEVTFIGDHAV